MTTDELCAAVKELGLRVTVDDGVPHLRGPNIPGIIVRVARFHRAELIRRFGPKPATPAGPRCPRCRGEVDERGRCWRKKCCDRICEHCGGATGSAFIATCLLCQAETD